MIMSTISLRDYNSEIESLVESGQNEEAIFHCKTILRAFPKSIDTYRILGKALLESKRYSEAYDVFSKVLSVFPDDFISHVGLSVVKEEDHDLDAAIWHMEQAFELQPSNLALQEELRRLIGRRDGVPPVKIRLTRGALVKMYARGELHQQAIAEIKSVLKDEPTRVDYRVLLAKMYQVSGSPSDAVEVASEIVNEYPYNYEANRILDELLPDSNLVDGIKLYRERLISLNPYYQFIGSEITEPSEVPAEKITLDRTEYSQSISQESGVPDWTKQIGVDWQEKDVFISTEPSDVLDQVEAFNQEAVDTVNDSTVSPFIGDYIPEIGNEPTDESLKSPEPLPDWITKAGWVRSTEPSSEEIQDTSLDSDKDTQESAEPSEELPNWLKSFGDQTESDQSPETSGNSVEENPPAISTEEFKDVLDNWSKEIEESTEKTKDETIAHTEDQSADWLSQFKSEIEAHEEDSNQSDLPDWLKNYSDEQETPSSSEEERLEWLTDQDLNAKEQADNLDTEIIRDAEKESEKVNTDELEKDDFSFLEEEIAKTNPPSSPVLSSEEEIKTPVTPIEESEIEKKEVPSWVKNILSESTSINEMQEDLRPLTQSEREEEQIESLVTDLPDSVEHEGVISEETNVELMSWLQDIEPEDEAVNEMPEIEPQGKESIEKFSIEDLSIKELNEESLELKASDENIGVLSEESSLPDFEDRLSELLDQPLDENISLEEVEESETESVIEELPDWVKAIQPAPEPEAESKASALIPEEEKISGELDLTEKMQTLFMSEEYSSLSELVDECFDEGVPVDSLIVSIKEFATEKQDSYELWQKLGDLYLEKMDFDNALMAYNNAEKILHI